jgi:hypothetical protein
VLDLPGFCVYFHLDSAKRKLSFIYVTMCSRRASDGENDFHLGTMLLHYLLSKLFHALSLNEAKIYISFVLLYSLVDLLASLTLHWMANMSKVRFIDLEPFYTNIEQETKKMYILQSFDKIRLRRSNEYFVEIRGGRCYWLAVQQRKSDHS